MIGESSTEQALGTLQALYDIRNLIDEHVDNLAPPPTWQPRTYAAESAVIAPGEAGEFRIGVHYRNLNDPAIRDYPFPEQLEANFAVERPFRFRRFEVDDADAEAFHVISLWFHDTRISWHSNDIYPWTAATVDGFSARHVAASAPPVEFEPIELPTGTAICMRVRNTSDTARSIRVHVLGEEAVPGSVDPADPRLIAFLRVRAATEAAASTLLRPREYTASAVVPPGGRLCLQFGVAFGLPGTGLPGVPETRSRVVGVDRPFRVRQIKIPDSQAPFFEVSGLCEGVRNVWSPLVVLPATRFAESAPDPVIFRHERLMKVGTVIGIYAKNLSDEPHELTIYAVGEEIVSSDLPSAERETE